jgi:hypothetical protein
MIMNKFILSVLLILTGCGSVIAPSPIVSQPPVVVQPQPVPVPVPNTVFHIGQIVFVRNWYGMVCRGQIINMLPNGLYVLNPVVCNGYLYYYNVVISPAALSF